MDGLTDKQIAEEKNRDKRKIFYKLEKVKHSSISSVLKKGKEVVDRQVENALLKKSLGFKETVRKAIKCKEVQYDNGKRISEKEHIEYADEEVYVPPDTTAQIFWLKNRRPDKWKDKQDVEVSGLAEEKTKLDDLIKQMSN